MNSNWNTSEFRAHSRNIISCYIFKHAEAQNYNIPPTDGKNAHLVNGFLILHVNALALMLSICIISLFSIKNTVSETLIRPI